MKLRPTLIVVLLFLLAACGGDDSDADASDAESGDAATAASDDSESDDSGSDDGGSDDGGSDDSGSGGGVVDAPPPGTAFAMVDGQEFTFDLPGGLPCEVSEDEFSFSFRIGDNEVVVGGGATRSGGEWFGSMSLQVFADNNVTDYSANIIDNPSAIAVDGQSASYSGPMQKAAPTEDGSPPQLEDVGTGTISFTCG
jgi:hypothetical protein